MHETFLDLLKDRSHWEFELLVGLVEMIFVDLLIFGMLWPLVRKHFKHHLDRDQHEQIQN